MAAFSIQAGVSEVCHSLKGVLYILPLLLFWLTLLSMATADRGGIGPQAMAWVVDRYGISAKGRIMAWRELIARYQGLDEPRQLQVVNDFFNRVRYSTDDETWGQTDYWATPVEMLSINAGDCEDYSIAKYFTLREMGMPVEKLRITYVKSLELDQAHMVLTYYERPGAEPLVLDNLTGRIETASRRQDLVPVYSFNGDGLWIEGKGEQAGGSERIGLWRGLIAKMADERLILEWMPETGGAVIEQPL